MSSAHDSPDKGKRRVPAAGDAIDAEIADHLATSAERLQVQGASADAAQARAEQRFGDPAAVRRSCYWIQHGDSIMFRTAVIALLSILCLGLTITAVASWRAQSQLAGEVRSLTEQLQLLANRPTAPGILEISGRAYVGSADRPAASTKLTLINAKDASQVRELVTDADGRFSSGPVAGGDYALLAETAERLADGRSPWLVQTAPIATYPGVAIPPQNVDLTRRFGRLMIETSRPLPSVTVPDRYRIETRLLVRVFSPQDRTKPWSQAEQPPLAWPIYCARDLSSRESAARGGFSSIVGPRERQFLAVLSGEEIQSGLADTPFQDIAGRFAPGRVAVAAAVLADVFPIDHEPPTIDHVDDNLQSRVQSMKPNWSNARMFVIRQGNTSPGPGQGETLDDDDFRWLTKGLGNVWVKHLNVSPNRGARLRHSPYLIPAGWLPIDLERAVTIADGRATRIRCVIPDDLETRVQTLIDSDDPRQIVQAALGDDQHAGPEFFPNSNRTPTARPESPFFRIATMEVLATKLLKEAEPQAVGSGP